jgi:hypothetical protein
MFFFVPLIQCVCEKDIFVGSEFRFMCICSFEYKLDIATY